MLELKYELKFDIHHPFQSATSAVALGCRPVSPHELLKKSLSGQLYSLVGFMDANPVRFQSWMFWGLISGSDLKIWGANMWDLNHLLLREELRVLSSFLIMGHYTRDRDYGEIVSQLVIPVFFSFARCVGVTQLVVGLFSEDIVTYVAVDLACMWEKLSSDSASATILNQTQLHHLFKRRFY